MYRFMGAADWLLCSFKLVAFKETGRKQVCDIVIESKEREGVAYEKEYLA